MTNTRQQVNYYKLVGRIDEDYYFCDYIFKDNLNNEPFNGAVATVVRPVYKDEYEDEGALRDWAEELWRMDVADNRTDLGLDDWINYNDIDQEQRFDTGMDSVIWDKMRELYPDEDEVPIFECVGGGRSFSKNMKFDEVFDQSLVNEINKVEKEDVKNAN